MATKQFKVAQVEEESDCNGLFAHLLIAKDSESWKVWRNRIAAYPPRWEVGEVVEVEMAMQEAADNKGEFLWPVWQAVGAENPIKYDLANPYDAVKKLWGERIARKLRAHDVDRFEKQRQKCLNIDPALAEGTSRMPAKPYLKKYMCWVVFAIHSNKRAIGHVMVSADGDAWLVERCRKSVRQSGWDEGRVVEVNMRLYENSRTGDRWMMPEWREHAPMSTPTTLEPEHRKAVAELWRARGEEREA